MAKVTYENLLGGPLLPTFVQLQMADQTIWFPKGLARDILVKVQDKYAPADFIILDMGADNPIILGRPFLNTANIIIYVGSGQIHLQFLGAKVKCPFNGYKTNMQVKDKAPKNKPRYYPRRRNKKGESANKVKLEKEEPAEPQAKIKPVWREKGAITVPISRTIRGTQSMNKMERSCSMDLKHGAPAGNVNK
jgi:hypothetical protein